MLGSGLDKAGDGLSVAAKRASSTLHSNASRTGDAVRSAIVGAGPVTGLRRAAGGLGWLAGKALTHTAGLAADAVNVVGKASTLTGRLAERSAPALGGALGGVVRGTAEMTSNAVDAAALSDSRIESMRAQLRKLGQAELKRSENRLAAVQSAQKRRRKDELLDLLVIGGVTLAQVLRDP